MVVPGVPPAVSTPEFVVMLAMPGLLLLHVPVADTSVSVIVPFIHTELGPPIADGGAITVTAFVALVPQPVE